MTKFKYAQPGEHPPASAKHISKWADLPGASEPARFDILSGDKASITVRGKNRKVLEGLMQGALYCASYCRISHNIMCLRRAGVNIETTIYKPSGEAFPDRYGLYELQSKVQRAGGGK